MTLQRGRRARDIPLPIVGGTLYEVCVAFDRAPSLVFRNIDGDEAELLIEHNVALVRTSGVSVLLETRPGSAFAPKELAAALDLLGQEVTHALAERDGVLEIRFANGWKLAIVPGDAYEAWHFIYPRPGRPVGSHRRPALHVTGDSGRLIVSDPDQ